MKSIRIESGDISLSVGRRMDFVHGKQKLLQDLELWLKEPYGTGPTTRSFGSYISDQIGSADPVERGAVVGGEIRRILGLYQAHQTRKLVDARNGGRLNLWSKQEVVDEIVDVRVDTRMDSVVVNVTLKTLASRDDLLTMELTLENSGV